MERVNSKLKLIEEEAEKEFQLLLNKNIFIMNTLNKIGTYLSKEYIMINEFNLEGNLQNYQDLFDYFKALYDRNLEKN